MDNTSFLILADTIIFQIQLLIALMPKAINNKRSLSFVYQLSILTSICIDQTTVTIQLQSLQQHDVNLIISYAGIYSFTRKEIIHYYFYNMNQVAHPYIYQFSPNKSDPDTETEESELTPSPSKQTHVINDHPAKLKLKSSLCKNYLNYGSCPYGKKCQFAHGPQELRCHENVNTSYKTKTCFSFTKQGYCKYGDCCNYRHQITHSKISKSRIIDHFPELLVFQGQTKSKLIKQGCNLQQK